jgi:hypothetical protein
MSRFRDLIGDFLDGFGPGSLFSSLRRSGAATQVFATPDVPCDVHIQAITDWMLRQDLQSMPTLATAIEDGT